jgi:hypothetical protein
VRRAVVLAGVAACYPGVDNSDCEIRCGEAGACPSNLSCVATFCVAEGQFCPVPDLMAAYSFDGVVGMTIDDDSGNGNTARSASSIPIISGPDGSAIEFAGDQSATVTHASSLELDGRGFTVSMFLLLDPLDPPLGDMAIVVKLRENGEQPNPSYEWGVEYFAPGSTVKLFVTNVDLEVVGGEVSVPLRQFAHVAFTFDGTHVRGYVDGNQELDNTFDQPFEIANFQQDLVIGADGRREQNFFGAIDSLRIYKRVLVESEIRADIDNPLTPMAGR